MSSVGVLLAFSLACVQQPFQQCLVHSPAQLQQAIRQNTEEFQLHLIDVGTGLAILVKGQDFTLLYDAGSSDDKSANKATGSANRLVAYLNNVLGRYQSPRCRSLGDEEVPLQATPPAIDFLFLSHPHEDHISHAIPLLQCFAVNSLWEPGLPYNSKGYLKLQQAIAEQPGIRYQTAVPGPCPASMPANQPCRQLFSLKQTIVLGKNASAQVLYAGQEPAANPNHYSLVLQLQLGTTKVLLTGDAESGHRLQWDEAPAGIEALLMQQYGDTLKSDILQLAHHGSKTSSRPAFIAKVAPRLALISAGPKRFAKVVLPDQPVVDLLQKSGIPLLRTDLHDKNFCPEPDKIGTNEPKSPAGCDNYVVFFD